MRGDVSTRSLTRRGESGDVAVANPGDCPQKPAQIPEPDCFRIRPEVSDFLREIWILLPAGMISADIQPERPERPFCHWQ
jgi:hypothetical protein